MSDTPDDFGEFLLGDPREAVLIMQLQEQAQNNPQKPGEAFGRLVAELQLEGKAVRVIKLLHVDLNAGRLIVTETRDGVETARLTVALRAEPEPLSADPAPPPPTGDETTQYFRLPFFGADMLPAHKLRAWAMERVDEDLHRLGALPRRLRGFGERVQEVYTFGQPLAPGFPPTLEASARALLRRPGVVRVLAEGWVETEPGHGLALLAEVAGEEGFWTASRPFVRKPGALGVWTADWSESEAREALHPALAAALLPSSAKVELGVPKPKPEPELGMFFGTLNPGEEAPVSAEQAAERVGRSWETKLFVEPLPEQELRVTVFRGRDWETWLIKGELPSDPDDMLRAIAANGAAPQSMAVARMGVVNFDGEPYRALITDAEAGGHRYTRALLLRMGPNGEALSMRVVGRALEDIGSDGWIGVAPVTEFRLAPLGGGEA